MSLLNQEQVEKICRSSCRGVVMTCGVNIKVPEASNESGKDASRMWRAALRLPAVGSGIHAGRQCLADTSSSSGATVILPAESQMARAGLGR